MVKLGYIEEVDNYVLRQNGPFWGSKGTNLMAETEQQKKRQFMLSKIVPRLRESCMFGDFGSRNVFTYKSRRS